MKKLTDIIYEALVEFGHNTCPHCQRDIGLRKYITEEDIEKWLEKEDIKC